jgi:Fe-S-cluster containining protein
MTETPDPCPEDAGSEEFADEPCELCGLCCRVLGPGIAPTETDLLRWMENGRIDILRHFSAVLEDGRRVACSALVPLDLGDLVTVELRDTETGELPVACPFLMRTEKKRYICSIHGTKPEMCINYQPWLFKETGRFTCKALMTAGLKRDVDRMRG